MFPVRNNDNRVVGFGARAIDSSKPKYLNSPATRLFNKRSLFFSSIDMNATATNDECLVVEGYVDVLKLSQNGLINIVSPMGTAITSDHIDLLMGKYDRIVFCLDGDSAGIASALRSIDLFTYKDITYDQVQFVSLPDGHDPDSFIDAYSVFEFREIIETRTDLVTFIFDSLQNSETLDGIGNKAAFSADIRSRLQCFKSDSIRSRAATMLSEILDIDARGYFDLT